MAGLPGKSGLGTYLNTNCSIAMAEGGEGGEGGESRSHGECSKEPLYRGYRRLVSSVAEQMRKENALSLAYTYELPSWYYDSRDHDHSYALRVLMALEGKGIYCPENLVGLAEALESVQREDLGKSVREFSGKYTHLAVTT